MHPFITKAPSKLGIERKFLKLIKGICEKPTTNNIFNSERLNAIPLKLETRQGYLVSSLLFNTMHTRDPSH